MNEFRLLVCGGRDWIDGTIMRVIIDGLAATHAHQERVLLHGGARGADKIAETLGQRDWAVEAFPADWRGHGRAAGPIRNKLMLGRQPHLVLAFKDDFDHTLDHGGTENMVKLAKWAGVPAYVVSH